MHSTSIAFAPTSLREPAALPERSDAGRHGVQRRFEVFRWRDESVLATMHVPDQRTARAAVACVLVNSGPAPRAGNSDLSSRIADRVASVGIPTMRMDFPGIGDSTGDSFKRIDDFRRAAQEAPLDDVLTEVIEQFCDRHGVEHVIVGGLCAGAVIAVRGARRMGSRCAGLILLEPDFVDARIAAGIERAGIRARVERVLRGLARRRWSRSSARILRPLYEYLDRGRMPEGIAQEVVDAWIHLTEARIPTFLGVADGLSCDGLCSRIALASQIECRRVTVDELEREPISQGALVTCCSLRETNHLLTEGDGPVVVARAIAAWMLRFA
jgi:pimeloyl-ACP methyl ester carboxylesterase